MNLEKSVIFIDDEEQILKALRRCLRGEGYELLTTTDPDQAIGWVKEGKAQVVVSDYRMQKTTGLELLKEIQQVDPRVVRVILSGYAEQDAVNQSLRDGVVYNYLLKPWKAESLKAKVKEYLERYDSQGVGK